MEYPILSIFAILVVTFSSLHILNKISRQKKTKPPPGPKPWPLIGNLNLIGALPHQSLHDLSQKYGPIMQLRFGLFPVVVGSSVEMAKIFLKTMDLTFASRPKTSAGKLTAYNYTDMTWSPYGPYWRQARKWCTMELFSPRRLESYEYIRKEEINSLLKKILKSSGKVFMLRDYQSTVSFNVISRMVLGKNYLDGGDKNAVVSPEEFKKMLDEIIVLNGVLNIGDVIPFINFLDLQGYVKRMKTASKKCDQFLELVLDEHEMRRRSTANYVSRDMVDVLLELAEDPTLEVKIDRHGVKAFIMDLLGGGTDTSAVTVEWAISELLKNPEIFKKATEELDRVVGKNKWVTEKDIPNLPYLESIVKETMRLHPVVPMLVPRLAREDCEVAGYDIKKGTRILVNTWTIQKDPSVYENPNEFCPERFLEKNIDVKGQDFELLPFGSGRRMCPGYALGMKVIQSSIANLLHGFNWSLPDNMKPEELNMEEIIGLSTPRKFPLYAVAHPRLPLDLYNKSL